MLVSDYNATLHSGAEPKQLALVYGEPFSGKTYLVGMLAKYYNIKWIDLDNGSISLTNLPAEYQKRIDVLKIQDSSTSPRSPVTVNKLLKSEKTVCVEDRTGKVQVGKDSLPEGMEGICWNLSQLTTQDVLVIDPLTTFSESIMDYYLKITDDLDFVKRGYTEYDSQGMYLRSFLMHLKKLPCHVVVITHQEELEQETSDKKLTPLGGTRNFSKLIARKFDYAVQIEIKNKSQRVNINAFDTNRAVVGARIPKEFKKPEDFAEIFKLPATGASSISASPNKSGNSGLVNK